jgi:hypothetical protein
VIVLRREISGQALGRPDKRLQSLEQALRLLHWLICRQRENLNRYLGSFR